MNALDPVIAKMVAGGDQMDCWVIYDHPRDFPDKIVARRFICWDATIETVPGGVSVDTNLPQPTGDAITATDIKALRFAMHRAGRVRLDRDSQDDPCIVEVWL